MKRRGFLKTSLAMGAAFTASEFLERFSAQPVSGGSFTAAANLAPSGWPLFFLPERIKTLRAQITADASTQARWEKFLGQANNLTEGKADPSTRASLTLGLAWQITGDERYAKKLRESLLGNVGASVWIGQDVGGHTPPWHSALATAAAVVSGVIAREALAGFLSADERQRVTAGILRLGILPILEDWVLPGSRIHALDSMGHNWWSVCISGAGVGALMLLGEDPRAAGWLGGISTALAGFFNYQGMVLLNKPVNFDPAGAFYESVHYAGYALESYLTFRLAWLNAVATPAPRIPALENIAGFFAHTLYPASAGNLAVDFGDSSLKPMEAPAMRLLAVMGFSPEITRWYLQREESDSSDPLALLYPIKTDTHAHNVLPGSIIYPVIGWAMLRSSWENDATLLGIKSGFTWNHAHADAGSFVLYHAGRPLLIDSGKCAYARSEYLDYYCQSRAHNVVLFNDEGQSVEDFHDRGVKFPGHVHDLLDAQGLKYIYADATGPMARWFKRNYRHWLWVDDVILVFDDILAHENGRFDWLLHYAGEARLHGATVELSNGPAQARIEMLYPADPAVRHETGLMADAPDQKTKYLRFSTTTKARVQKFLVAIVPRPVDAALSPPKIETLDEPDALGVRISGPDQITEVYLNLLSDGRRMHLNSNNVMAGWETDAYLLAVTRPSQTAKADIESVTRYFAVGCSYLRREGQSILESFLKVTTVFQPGESAEISFPGQPQTEMAILALHEPSRLQVNGQPRSFQYEPDERMVRF
jgi:hypothetical protein